MCAWKRVYGISVGEGDGVAGFAEGEERRSLTDILYYNIGQFIYLFIFCIFLTIIGSHTRKSASFRGNHIYFKCSFFFFFFFN